MLLRETSRKLEAAGVNTKEIQNGLRAQDSAIVASLLGFHFGLRALPIRRRKKIPCIKGWQNDASNELEVIFGWRTKFGCDFSILTGVANGVWAIDVDAPSDFERAVNALGPLPPTVRVESGRQSGGFHLWFRAPSELTDLRTTSKVLGGCFDVRGRGGQIVIPGSCHRTGTKYRWADGCAPDEIAIADLPTEWYAALPKYEEKGARIASPRLRSVSGQYSRIENKRSDAIGDGKGGFHRPIYLNAIKLFQLGGVDADAATLVRILRAKVMAAPFSTLRDPADLGRYSSETYLTEQVERARAWVREVNVENKNEY